MFGELRSAALLRTVILLKWSVLYSAGEMLQTSQDGSIASAIRQIAADPFGLLLRRWNWKTALLSALWRAPLFAAVAARGGLAAAAGAGSAELVFQTVTAGFFGALSQSLCRVRPFYHGLFVLAAITLLIQHPLELAVHRMRGTPHPLIAVGLSICATGISAAINLRLMRRGWLLMGASAR